VRNTLPKVKLTGSVHCASTNTSGRPTGGIPSREAAAREGQRGVHRRTILNPSVRLGCAMPRPVPLPPPGFNGLSVAVPGHAPVVKCSGSSCPFRLLPSSSSRSTPAYARAPSARPSARLADAPLPRARPDGPGLHRGHVLLLRLPPDDRPGRK
jgi:hypothetical protein